jgi:hypothetical protein
MSKTKIPTSQVTHVILSTGHIPPLSDLLSIEAALRDDLDHYVTCLFACESYFHLGVLIPNPHGFRPPPYSTPTDHELALDKIMITQRGKPFYEPALANLNEQRSIVNSFTEEEDRLEGFSTLYDTVEEWAREPITPDKAYDHTSYTNMMRELTLGGPCRLDYAISSRHDLIVERNETPVMSYNDRVKETEEIIELFGSIDEIEGFICFSVNPSDDYIDPRNIMDVIIENDLSYVDKPSLELTSTDYISNDNKKIMILTYT